MRFSSGTGTTPDRQNFIHHETKKSEKIFLGMEKSSPSEKFGALFIIGKLKDKQDPPERSAARQAVIHSKNWKQEQISPKRLDRAENPDRAGAIGKSP